MENPELETLVSLFGCGMEILDSDQTYFQMDFTAEYANLEKLDPFGTLPTEKLSESLNQPLRLGQEENDKIIVLSFGDIQSRDGVKEAQESFEGAGWVHIEFDECTKSIENVRNTIYLKMDF